MTVLSIRRFATFPLALLIIAVVAVSIRLIGVGDRWLWGDELLAVNWSAHGVYPALVQTLRFDVHPPLYYLQLAVWAWGGTSDGWLMANSIAWSTATCVLLAHAGHRLFGARVGFAAGVLLAVSPAALAYADTVRMYAFSACLLVWAWYALERWLLDPSAGRRAAAVVLSQAAVAASHGAGLFMLSGCVVYGATRAYAAGRRELRRWLGLEVLVAMLALPAIVIALSREVTHTAFSGWPAVIDTWLFLTSGPRGWGPLASGAALVVTGWLVLSAWRTRSARWLGLTMVCAPLALAAALSLGPRSVWIERVFVPLVPFICLVAALGVGHDALSAKARRWPWGVGVTSIVVLWLLLGLVLQGTRAKGDGFKLAADYVRSIERPGDLIAIDGDHGFWCFNWYYLGPRWGQPRHAFIQTDAWERLMARLPAGAIAWLDLDQSSRTVAARGITAVMRERRTAFPQTTGRLTNVRHQSTGTPDAPGFVLESRRQFEQLVVETWTPIGSAPARE